MAASAELIQGASLFNTLDAENGSENLFQALVEQAPTMLWVTDADGSLTYFNRRWLDFTGVPMEEVLGAGWIDCLHPDDRARCFDYAMGQIARHEPLEMQYRLRRHDGLYFETLVLGEPLHQDNGDFLGYVGCTIDIDTQVQGERKLIETNLTLAKHSQDIALLNELNDNLQVCKNIDETKPILKRYGRKLFPSMAVTVSLLNESRNLIEPFIWWGGKLGNSALLSPDDCWALRKSKPHCELADDEIICPHFSDCQGKRYVCIPMLAYGEVMGNMHMDLTKFNGHENTSALSNEAIDDLLQLATVASDQIALALANLKLRATLQFQSTRDSVTKLHNRRYVVEALEREVSRAVRSTKPMAVLVIDIDNFKRYNDTHGHEAGDHVLREFGTLLRQSVRGSDIASRYGGEEFLVILPESSAADAFERADEIRQRVVGLGLEFRGEQLGQITISVGISAHPESGLTSDDLITNADSALYQAKANGRNCVVVATPLAGSS